MDLLEYLKESEDVLVSSRENMDVSKVDEAIDLIVEAVSTDKPLLVCGNGGSASDASHIAGELVGRFSRERRALNCICLSSNPTIITAWSNDYAYETVFARQVEAHGRPGAVLLGLSTSGNSTNVVRAFETAKASAMSTIAMTGEGGGQLAGLSDVLIEVPCKSTPLIQQVHVCLYHYICHKIEERLLA
jgi:D-sedoheptulose 7-phosphate isomerase